MGLDPPDTRYTGSSGGVQIAYQVHGEGPDLVVLTGPVNHLDVVWEFPPARRWFERLGGFARVIRLDRRGMGLSDPFPGTPTFEQHLDDVIAVMDAVGCERAAVFGSSEAGRTGAILAATRPDRVVSLASFGAAVAGRVVAEGAGDAILDIIETAWGTAQLAPLFGPSGAGDPEFDRFFARVARQSASPSVARAITALAFKTDATELLPSVNVPTLVLHRTGDRVVPVSEGRRFAELVPGARFLELPGEDHLSYLGDQGYLEDLEEHVTGTRTTPEPDRVLATVLFTDMARSTERLGEVGDRRWRDVLDAYDRNVRREAEAHRGRVVNWTGDGHLLMFDGPGRAVQAARRIVDDAAGLGIALRAGLHAGEVEVREEHIAGMAVHIGARVMGLAEPGEVLVSSTVHDLMVGSTVVFTPRGERALKGVDGTWRLWAVEG